MTPIIIDICGWGLYWWDLEYTKVNKKTQYVRTCGALTNPKMGMRCEIILGVCRATGLASVSLGLPYVMRDLARLQYHVGPGTT